jgi:hypothetical protein
VLSGGRSGIETDTYERPVDRIGKPKIRTRGRKRGNGPSDMEQRSERDPSLGIDDGQIACHISDPQTT